MSLIGLYGDSRVGKDTIAQILQEDFDYEWRSFANPLRTILLDIDPFLRELGLGLKESVERYGWDKVKERAPSAVDMMIQLGQSARDNISPDIWITPVLSDLPSKLVISDVRQPNEYDSINKLGGEVWKIVRPGSTRRGMDGLLDDRDFPVVIYNNSSIADLKSIVRKISRK